MRPRILCPNCSSDIEHLAYCGVCGQPLPDTQPDGEGRLAARFGWLRRLPQTPAYRIVWLIGAVLILLALLANEPGVAIALGAILVPVLTVLYLTRIDIYEREPWTVILGAIAVGGVVGLVAGWLSTLAFDQLWFDTSPFNLGAGGYAGEAANGEGSAPISVVLINGVLIPILSAVATLAGPLSFRRSAAFRNEVMDGVILGAAAGGGFALVMAIVYFWPVFFDSSMPGGTVSEWTASLAGLVILRPLIATFAGGLLGLAVWGYAQTQRSRDLAWPLAAGMLGWIGLPIGQLLLMPYAAIWELIWAAVVLVVVFAFFRVAVTHGLSLDRQLLVGEGGAERVVCPSCQRVTPDGTYCAFCGAELHPESAAVPAVLGEESVREALEADETPDVTGSAPRISTSEEVREPLVNESPDERTDMVARGPEDQSDSSALASSDGDRNYGEDAAISAASHRQVTPTASSTWYEMNREDEEGSPRSSDAGGVKEDQSASLSSTADPDDAWLPAEADSSDEVPERPPDPRTVEGTHGTTKGTKGSDEPFS